MSSSIDTPERRLAVHGSPEISAAKHLARTYGFSMRRRRRVGPVIFDLGLRHAPGVLGELHFADDGRMIETPVLGQAGLLSMLQLAEVLEYGTLAEGFLDPTFETVVATVVEEVETVVLELDAVTGPILLPVVEAHADGSLRPIAVEETAVELVLQEQIYRPTTRVISVPMVITVPARPVRASRADRLAAALEAVPKALGIWVRFLLGVALLLQATGPLLVMPLAGAADLGGAMLSTVGALLGAVLTYYAIHDNDKRVHQLRALRSFA